MKELHIDRPFIRTYAYNLGSRKALRAVFVEKVLQSCSFAINPLLRQTIIKCAE